MRTEYKIQNRTFFSFFFFLPIYANSAAKMYPNSVPLLQKKKKSFLHLKMNIHFFIPIGHFVFFFSPFCVCVFVCIQIWFVFPWQQYLRKTGKKKKNQGSLWQLSYIVNWTPTLESLLNHTLKLFSSKMKKKNRKGKTTQFEQNRINYITKRMDFCTKIHLSESLSTFNFILGLKTKTKKTLFHSYMKQCLSTLSEIQPRNEKKTN